MISSHGIEKKILIFLEGRGKRARAALPGWGAVCSEVLGHSDLCYILQGVVISAKKMKKNKKKKHRQTAATAKGPAALMDGHADAVMIVACCASTLQLPAESALSSSAGTLLQPVMSNY